MGKLLLLFLILPVVELWLLIEVGQRIGSLTVVLLVIGTGLIGFVMARAQGLATFKRAVEEIKHGMPPGESVIDGVCVLLGGGMLLTPGLITDLLGFLLLFPVTRNKLKEYAGKVIRRKWEEGTLHLWWRW